MRSLHYFVVFTLKFMYVHVPNAEPLIQLKIWKQTICLPSCECRCCTLGLQGTPLWIFGMGHVDGCNMSVVGVTNRVRKRFPVWLRSMPSFVAVPDSTCDELSCSRLDNSSEVSSPQNANDLEPTWNTWSSCQKAQKQCGQSHYPCDSSDRDSHGCGSKCKVWIKPRSHKRSRPLIQTPDPDLSKGGDPDLWSRPLEWYYLWASWCLQLFTLPSSQATNCFKATLPSCQASKLHLLQSHAAKLSSSPAARVVQPRFQAFKLQLFSSNQAV